MRQVVQNYKSGILSVEEVPPPMLKSGGMTVRTVASAISLGTERTKINQAKMNLLQKARTRPDQVSLVLKNLKQEGFFPTIKKAFNKLNTPVSLGYSSAGIVTDVASDVSTFKSGDAVCCVGEGVACHAEEIWVPQGLAVSIPQNISFSDASFAGIGAIAMQGIRLARLEAGETALVIGLGLLGQIVAQILSASGCRVIGIEPQLLKRELALKLGIAEALSPENPKLLEIIKKNTQSQGTDAVIVTAASQDNKPLVLAGQGVREYGRVVLIGAVPIQLPRKEYYEKEIHFVVSRGFGPGTYDIDYHKGHPSSKNYPSWSLQDNIKVFLSLLSEKKINIKELITHEFPIKEAEKAYNLLQDKKTNYLGILLNYDQTLKEACPKKIPFIQKEKQNRGIRIGVIGAGSFAQGYLLPKLKKYDGIELIGVSTTNGMNAKNVLKKFGFSYCTTDSLAILEDPNIQAVVITSRHDSHASYLEKALKLRKPVFVEKPLATSREQLNHLSQVWNENRTSFMVGFNRRFSSLAQKAKSFLNPRTGPLSIHYRINAGPLPSTHWAKDKTEGGNRIIGEICHFVDFGHFLTDALTISVYASAILFKDSQFDFQDNVSAQLELSDGSHLTIQYVSSGDSSFPRERVEIFGGQSVVIIDNFQKMILSSRGKRDRFFKFSRDMGYDHEISCFIEMIQKRSPMPIPFEELIRTTETTFSIEENIRNNLNQSTCLS